MPTPKPVRVRPSAAADLEEIRDWYEAQRAGLSDEFLEAIDNCLESIARHPLANAIAIKDTRQALVQRFPYSVFYQVTEDAIFIRAVFHNSRKPARWRRRLREEDS